METVKRRRKLFLEGPIVRALVTLAIPIVLGNVLQAGYQLTDAFWVGRLGASAVAAVSVSGSNPFGRAKGPINIGTI
jgi:Na+-driven multidrug efflux pump